MTRRASSGYAVAGFAALSLTIIGLWWFIAPESGTRAFGVALPDDDRLVFAYLKAMQCLIAAILIGVFVLRRDRRGTLLVLAAVTIVPTGDLLAVYWAGEPAGDLWPVNVALAAVLVTGMILLGPKDEQEPSEVNAGVLPEWVPRTPGKVAVLVVAAIMFATIAFGFTSWWFIDPAGLSADFGAELSGKYVAYAYVKGFEDMFVSVAVILFLLRRRRVELMLVLAVSMLIVVGDQLAQTLAGYFVPSMFVAHVSYLLVVGSALAVLRTGDPARSPVARPTACATRSS